MPQTFTVSEVRLNKEDQAALDKEKKKSTGQANVEEPKSEMQKQRDEVERERKIERELQAQPTIARPPAEELAALRRPASEQEDLEVITAKSEIITAGIPLPKDENRLVAQDELEERPTNSNSEPTERVRADSDADIQANKSNTNSNNINSNNIDIGPQALNTDSSRSIKPNEVKKKPKTVQALELAYALPPESKCVIPGEGYPRVGILYRPKSFAIKGQSLTNIDKLVAIYKRCGGKFLVLENALEDEQEKEARLIQQRQDEVKYYLLQRRIPKDDMIFPDNS